MAGDMNNNGKVPYPEVEDLGSDDDTLTGSGKSSDSNVASSGKTISQNQEDAPREVSQELAVVQQQPVDMEFSSNGSPYRTPNYTPPPPITNSSPNRTPNYTPPPPISNSSPNRTPNYTPPPPISNSYSPATPQVPILVIPLPHAPNRQMDIYNPAMGRYGYSPMQNQEMLHQFSLSSPSSYSSPLHIYPPPSQNQVLVQPESTSYYYPPEPPVYPMQQQNYQYLPSQQVQSPVLQTPPPYQSPQTNLRHLNDHDPCPYGYNVLYPYPALCPYCFPQSIQEFNPPQQEALEEYDVIQPSAHTSRNRNELRRANNEGKCANCSGCAKRGPYQKDK